MGCTGSTDALRTTRCQDRDHQTDLRAQYLIETEDVANLIAEGPHANLRFINTSFYPPGSSEITAEDQHVQGRLTKETQYLSIKTVADQSSSLPMTLPSLDTFIEHMRRLRIGKDCQIICYDHEGMFGVARAAWMLRFFGAKNVRIMNGGLQKWLKEGHEVYQGLYSDGEGLPESNNYVFGVLRPDAVVLDIEKVYDIVSHIYHEREAKWQIADSRPKAAYDAASITGSLSVPVSDLVDHEMGCLRPIEELREIFSAKGIRMDQMTLFSCKTGTTSCAVQLALAVCGMPTAQMTLYDGSWNEYSKHQEPNFTARAYSI